MYAQKKCKQCGSFKIIKNGRTDYGKQLYRCRNCDIQFVKRYCSLSWPKKLFKEYALGKQTLKQLADKYGKTKETIKKYLDRHRFQSPAHEPTPRPIVIGIDCSFFGRGYGLIIVRCPELKQNLYWKEITTENKLVYQETRQYLEAAGFTIAAVVIDAKHGIKEAFSDLIVQICQYHQQQIVRRYLTNKPKTPAGQELQLIARSLTQTTESLFAKLLNEWHDKWKAFLKERTFASDQKHWWYTHKRIRSAYRSLKSNLPYLFSCQEYPNLNIPNTNNSLEGYFSKMKKLLNNHNGLKSWRRYKLIEAILNS